MYICAVRRPLAERLLEEELRRTLISASLIAPQPVAALPVLSAWAQLIFGRSRWACLAGLFATRRSNQTSSVRSAAIRASHAVYNLVSIDSIAYRAQHTVLSCLSRPYQCFGSVNEHGHPSIPAVSSMVRKALKHQRCHVVCAPRESQMQKSISLDRLAMLQFGIVFAQPIHRLRSISCHHSL